MKAIFDENPEKGVVDNEEILKILPHRYPFLLVDRVEQMELNEKEPYLVARKNVTINEPFFPGHFPGRPMMPGVLMIEAMAQAGGILIWHNNKESGLQVLLKVDKVKFRKPVVPGDCLKIHVILKKVRGKVIKIEAKGYVDKVLVTEAQITYSLFDT